MTGASFDGAETVVVPQLHFIGRPSTFPFVPQRQILMVQTFQQTAETPQLLFDTVVNAHIMQVVPSSPTSAVACAWLVLLVTIQLALCQLIQTSSELLEDFTTFSTCK